VSPGFRSRWKRWVVIAAAIGIVATAVWAQRRYSDIAALQDGVARSWEITFNVWGKPPTLPEFIDEFAALKYTERYVSTHGTSNLHALHLERFRGLFRGRITTIAIHYPIHFEPGIGAALRRFRHLETLSIEENSDDTSTLGSTADELIDAVVDAKSLRTLSLMAVWLTDDHVRRVGEMRQLEELTLGYGRFGGAALEALAKIPSLKKIDVSEALSLSAEETKTFASAHPRIKVIPPPTT